MLFHIGTTERHGNFTKWVPFVPVCVCAVRIDVFSLASYFAASKRRISRIFDKEKNRRCDLFYEF